MSASRLLRSAHLQIVADDLWVVDELHPVAAVLDPSSGSVRRVVAWPQVPPWHEAVDEEWRTLSDGEALWVQSGDGPPGRVSRDGGVVVATVRTTASLERWRLAAAGPSGAWLVGEAPVQDIAASPDAPPPSAGSGRLLVAAPDGDLHQVLVEHPVHDVLGTDDAVLVQVDTGRGQRIDLAGGLRWALGRDLSDRHPHTCVATGHDPEDGRERLRVPLGRGTVRAAVGTPAALFVAVRRPGGDGAVLAVDPASGAVRETAASAVDVTQHRRPLGPPPADLTSSTRYWLRYWADEAGAVEPAEEGMSDGRAQVVGEWPGTAIEITFDWNRRPGLRLRRRLHLFDELGRHTPPEYSDVHLMEDLATDQVPPPGDAVDGVLDA